MTKTPTGRGRDPRPGHAGKGNTSAQRDHHAGLGLRVVPRRLPGRLGRGQPGLAIREQQGGAQIASAISTIAGGGIIIAASVYFGMLDTSWLPA